MISLPLAQMSRTDKLMALEALWEDLARNEAEFVSPAWHAEELAATERRVNSGEEQFVDWESAKKQLRSRSERRSGSCPQGWPTWKDAEISTRLRGKSSANTSWTRYFP